MLTASRVALHLPDLTLTGTVHYDHRRSALWLTDDHTGEIERLSVDLTQYGLVAGPGEVWVRDWSEHAGLADALVMAGLVMVTDREHVGPFGSRAYRCMVLDPALLSVAV